MTTFDRWLYRGGRPNRVARILNRIWATVEKIAAAFPVFRVAPRRPT